MSPGGAPRYPAGMAWTTVRRLGRGSMGVVDLAEDPDGRLVARKRVPLHGSARELAEARRRIRREADVLAALDHPAIVPLLAVEDDGDDVVLVLPYYAGGTLADRVASEGPLGAGEVAALAARLLGALAAAHRAGIVHRDVKPGNVLFDDAGLAHLADFGIARHPDVTVGLTADGIVLGTPPFMAPEQARGEDVGAAADVFSLGATLLYAATGRGPWGAGDPAVLLRRAAAGRVRVPRELPAPTRRLLAAMLERDPARRPAAAALAGGVHGTHWRTARVATAPRRRARLAAGVAAVAVAGTVGGFAAARDGGGAPAPAPAAAAACTPLPYQPCGEPPAPFTDGRVCVADHGDYDANPANGCEAAPDTVDGETLRRRVRANLVPAADVDRYPFEVADHFHFTCDGTLKVTLTAPPGVAQRLRVLDASGTVLGEVISGDGEPATARISEPSCLGDDAQTLTAEVSAVSGRSARPYELERTGSF